MEAEQVEETNCYCTEEAEEKIKKLIESYPEKGIHFLDSGNYHYVTKFWMEKLRKPFALVLFDQHTDMQEAAFFGLLSCGSWVREALEQNELLKAVCVVGPPQKSIEEVFKSSKEEPWIDKVCFVSGEELEAHRQTAYDEFLKENSIPVYLSIDKDILREEDASVNWDQGKTSLEELLALVKSCFEKQTIAGVDICGENAKKEGNWEVSEVEKNSKTNLIMLEKIGQWMKEQEAAEQAKESEQTESTETTANADTVTDEETGAEAVDTEETETEDDFLEEDDLF